MRLIVQATALLAMCAGAFGQDRGRPALAELALDLCMKAQAAALDDKISSARDVAAAVLIACEREAIAHAAERLGVAAADRRAGLAALTGESRQLLIDRASLEVLRLRASR